MDSILDTMLDYFLDVAGNEILHEHAQRMFNVSDGAFLHAQFAQRVVGHLCVAKSLCPFHDAYQESPGCSFSFNMIFCVSGPLRIGDLVLNILFAAQYKKYWFACLGTRLHCPCRPLSSSAGPVLGSIPASPVILLLGSVALRHAFAPAA